MTHPTIWLPILVVEDSRVVRYTILRLLTLHGLQTIDAQSADEAQFVLQDHPVHAIVTDYHLGGAVTGVELLMYARARQPSALRILISGFPTEHMAEALSAGDVQHLLPKPFAAADLLSVLGIG